MSLFSLLLALLLDHFHSLDRLARADHLLLRVAKLLESYLNAGKYRHGVLAWCLAVLPPVLALLLVETLLRWYAPPLLWLLDAGVLYAVIGFGALDGEASAIAVALKQKDGDMAEARARLAAWGEPLAAGSASDVARQAIGQVFLRAYRQLFGVLAWFLVFGAAGAVLYVAARALDQAWGARDESAFGAFGRFSATAFAVLDWLPLRATALSFAIVGNFEDAVYCWRTQAKQGDGAGILLSSGAGALGVRLGGEDAVHPEFGLGDAPDADDLESAQGLVWRVLVLWLLLRLLLALARLGGS